MSRQHSIAATDLNIGKLLANSGHKESLWQSLKFWNLLRGVCWISTDGSPVDEFLIGFLLLRVAIVGPMFI